ERRRQRYLGSRERAEVAHRVVIVVDDGIATGATTRAALRAIRMRNPAKLVLAVPVAPTESLPEMRQEAEDVVCLEDYDGFGAIGFYYSDFHQVSDQDVIDTLARFPARARANTRKPAAWSCDCIAQAAILSRSGNAHVEKPPALRHRYH